MSARNDGWVVLATGTKLGATVVTLMICLAAPGVATATDQPERGQPQAQPAGQPDSGKSKADGATPVADGRKEGPKTTPVAPKKGNTVGAKEEANKAVADETRDDAVAEKHKEAAAKEAGHVKKVDAAPGKRNDEKVAAGGEAREPESNCSFWKGHVGTDVAVGGLKLRQQISSSARAAADDDAEWGKTGRHGSYFVLAFGPDGTLLGNAESLDIGEDEKIVVLLYRAPAPNAGAYSIKVEGCTRSSVRVDGSWSATTTMVHGPGAGDAERAGTPLDPMVQFLNTCSADQPVTITVSVPPVLNCGENSPQTRITTEKIYNYTVTVGAAIGASFTTSGDYHSVGATPGIGGAPGQVFDRASGLNYGVVGVVTWFPAGYRPTNPEFFSGRRVGLSTAITLTSPLSNVNLMLSYALAPGLLVHAGLDLLHKDAVLDGGLQDGSTFNDDTSRLPTHDVWSAHPRMAIALSLGLDLARKLIGP